MTDPQLDRLLDDAIAISRSPNDLVGIGLAALALAISGLEPAEREATLREIERHTLRQAVHKFLGTSRVPEVRFGPLH